MCPTDKCKAVCASCGAAADGLLAAVTSDGQDPAVWCWGVQPRLQDAISTESVGDIRIFQDESLHRIHGSRRGVQVLGLGVGWDGMGGCNIESGGSVPCHTAPDHSLLI